MDFKFSKRPLSFLTARRAAPPWGEQNSGSSCCDAHYRNAVPPAAAHLWMAALSHSGRFESFDFRPAGGD
jgi:hypothetical protein